MTPPAASVISSPVAAFTIEQAAVYLNISRASVGRLIHSGALDSFTVGRARRISRDACDRFMASGGV